MKGSSRAGEKERQPRTGGGADSAAARRPIPQIARIIWTTGFLIGAASHAIDILAFGWLPYEFMPLGFNIYWTSLLVLDALAALLIWLRPGTALLLGCLIMASNLPVNAWTAFVAGHSELLPSLALQSAFAVFVFFLAIRQKLTLTLDPDSR